MRIAIFSLIGWSFLKQRPQVFGAELARLGHEIFYFEPFTFSRLPRKMIGEMLKSVRIRKAPEPNVNLLSTPYFWSYMKYEKLYPLNKILGKKVLSLLRDLKIDFIIDLDPEYADPIRASGIPHAYDHVDDTQYMENVIEERYVTGMNKLKESGAFTIYIQKPEADNDPKGLFIPNGCYPEEFFPVDCPKKFDAMVIGSIAKWCDMDSILASDKEILVVGPMDVDKGDNMERFVKARKSNIYYVPEISKEVANLWVNSAHVGLVPFLEDHPVVEYAMPVKILEYFLCNMPVVTFRNKGIEEQYGNLVTFYSSAGKGASLDEAIDTAKERIGDIDYRAFAKTCTWPEIIKRLEEKIVDVVGKK